MRPLLFLAACAAFLSTDASAAGQWVWQNGTAVYVDFTKQNIEKIQKRDRGWDVYQKAQDLDYRDSRLPGGKLPIPVNGGYKIPRDTLVKLAKKAVKAGRVTTPVGLGSLAAQEAWELCQEGKWLCVKETEPGAFEGAGYWGPNDAFLPIIPVGKYCSDMPKGKWYLTVDSQGKVTSARCNPAAQCGPVPQGFTKSGEDWCGSTPAIYASRQSIFDSLYRPGHSSDNSTPRPVTDEEMTRGLDDLFDSQLSNEAYDAMYGEIEPFLTPADVTDAHQSGQASSVPRDTTTTLPNGDVKTESIRYDVTYNDGDYIINQVTNTTVNGENQGTTEKPLEPEPGIDYGNSELPAVPDFYEQKYPNGLAGVWSEKSAAFSQTPLMTWLNSFSRGLPSGGECPRWILPTSGFGTWLPGIGDADVSPPCYVWDFAKWALLITTLIMCRRIIFGG